MRKSIVVLGMAAILISGAVFADIDLSDFDDDLMRNMDESVKDLDSNIANKDAKAATADAEFIAEGLQWAQGYFTKKGNVDNAVQFAAKGHDLAAAIAKASAANDFDAASTSYTALVKTCRSCHDVYKPPSP